MLSPRDIALFSLLARYRYLRSNFIYAFIGGDRQHLTDRLRLLWDNGYLERPAQQWETANALYNSIVYENTEKAERVLRQHAQPVSSNTPVRIFKHALMVCDIVVSFEIAAKTHGLTFLPSETLDIRSLELPCEISHTFKTGKTHHSKKALEPDALFGLRGSKTIWFALEADRGTEPKDRDNLEQTSYLRKILGYRDIVKNRTYQTHWGTPNLLVLNVTTKSGRAKHIIDFMDIELKQNPSSMLFKEVPILASFEETPQPLLSLLTDPWERAGHPPLSIGKEVMNGHRAHEGTDRTA